MSVLVVRGCVIATRRIMVAAEREVRGLNRDEQGLNCGIPPDLRSPTSAIRSATCNLGSTTLKYRSGTFLWDPPLSSTGF